ncbi:MAG: type IV toxin-antitoxin system AbiEi family antitoxin domain-containing protein [Desulfobacteraceae bacterium]|nr:type IV toxin-antitoxin system AbiEi family antitoxin domain-containing protein [Desulfobacteraceae bacterium]
MGRYASAGKKNVTPVKKQKKTAKNTLKKPAKEKTTESAPEKKSVRISFTISLPSLQKIGKEKKVKRTPVIETVVNVVKRSKRPVTVDDIEERTGFAKRQIRNAVYVAKKEGKIKCVGRGIYTKI